MFRTPRLLPPVWMVHSFNVFGGFPDGWKPGSKTVLNVRVDRIRFKWTSGWHAAHSTFASTVLRTMVLSRSRLSVYRRKRNFSDSLIWVRGWHDKCPCIVSLLCMGQHTNVFRRGKWNGQPTSTAIIAVAGVAAENCCTNATTRPTREFFKTTYLTCC